jgi:hypothetical protein
MIDLFHLSTAYSLIRKHLNVNISDAVGMPVTRHPPHRSRRAELPHRAPASGIDAKALS